MAVWRVNGSSLSTDLSPDDQPQQEHHTEENGRQDISKDVQQCAAHRSPTALHIFQTVIKKRQAQTGQAVVIAGRADQGNHKENQAKHIFEQQCTHNSP
jgi:hypothetical protein